MWLRERGSKTLPQDLEQLFPLGKPVEPVPSEAAEPHTAGRRSPDRVAGRSRQQDLPPVRRGANAGRRVNREPDVPDVGQGGTPAMDTDADPDSEVAGPATRFELPLDLGRGRHRVPRPVEHREELVRAHVDLASAGARDPCPEDDPDVVQQVSIPLAGAAEERGRALDVGHQQGDESGRQRLRVGRGRLDLTEPPEVIERVKKMLGQLYIEPGNVPEL